LVNFNVCTLSATEKADANQCPREALNDEPSRSKAIRRLIEIALTVQTAEQLRRCTAQAGAFGIARHNRVDEDLQRCRFVQLFGS
jgi:hypothetical protein